MNKGINKYGHLSNQPYTVGQFFVKRGMISKALFIVLLNDCQALERQMRHDSHPYIGKDQEDLYPPKLIVRRVLK